MTTTLALVDGEVHVLTELVAQLLDLYEAADDHDPAIDRLSPAAYRDNDEASAEFRRLTRTDLLTQRSEDASTMLGAINAAAGSAHDETDATITVVLDDASVLAWMRTLASLRLVMATRLGIGQNDHHDHDDPNYALYDWLAYRLETLVEATEA